MINVPKIRTGYVRPRQGDRILRASSFKGQLRFSLFARPQEFVCLFTTSYIDCRGLGQSLGRDFWL